MIDQQTLLFPEGSIETLEYRQHTTIKDLIRELISIGIEIDIALDEVTEGDTTRAKKTLKSLSDRIENTLINIR